MKIESAGASVAVWLTVAILTTLAMEAWAAWLHGSVWHRWLWFLHRSHHRPNPRGWEANDALSILHVPIAVALIVYGLRAAPSLTTHVAFGVGVGMTCFGLLYLLFHDGLVHGRLPMQWALRFRLCRLWADAHRLHHTGGRGPYGFFYVPKSVRARLGSAKLKASAGSRLSASTLRLQRC